MKLEHILLSQETENITLTGYILDVFEPGCGATKRPAVIICPGGAYLSLSEHEGEPVAMAFAKMGYHAFVLRYHVYGDGADLGTSWENMPVKPDIVHPAPIRDIGRAMLCIRAHAEEWAVDADRIALCGFSAGAHNCALYSTSWSRPVIQEYFIEEARSLADRLGETADPVRYLKPAACILGYTLSDYVFMAERIKNASPVNRNFNAQSNLAFLGTATPEEALLREVSPALLVDENTPPTFLWATAADQMVSPEHTLRMALALTRQHIPFELHIFEEGPHGTVLGTQATAASKKNIYPKISKWIDLCDVWLEKYLALELSEMSKWESMITENIGK